MSDRCPRCGTQNVYDDIGDLCFGCWAIEHGFENRDALINKVERVLLERGLAWNTIAEMQAKLDHAVRALREQRETLRRDNE